MIGAARSRVARCLLRTLVATAGVLAFALAVGFLAAPALAAPPPTAPPPIPPAATAPGAGSAPGQACPAPGAGSPCPPPCPPTGPPPGPCTPPPAPVPAALAGRDLERPGGGLMDRVLGPSGAPGPPADHYDVGYDEGGAFSLARKVLGFFTEATFALVRWMIQVCAWVVGWALRFGLAEALARPAAQVASTYQGQVVGRLGLSGWVWLFTVAWCGFQVLRGRLGRGVGELGVSFALAALAAATFSAPANLLLGEHGALGRARELSLEVAGLTVPASAPAPGAGPEALTAPLTAGLTRAFVELPHQLLAWGVVLDDAAPGATPPRPASRPACLAAYRELVASGPHGTSDGPRRAMADAGCGDLADFNANPTPDRLMAAVLVLLAAVFVGALTVLVAASLAAAQLVLAALAALAPFALAVGVAPSSGRHLLLRWAAAVARALAAVVMTAAFLSLFLVGVKGLLSATSGQPLVVQMGVLDLLVACSFVARSRLAGAGRRVADAAGRRLEGARVGGTGGRAWLGPAALGAAAGAGAAGLWGENRSELRRVADPLRRAFAPKVSPSARPAGAGAGAARGSGGSSPERAASAARLRARLAGSPAARATRTTARVAAGGAKLALASTVGAPVYLPRATKAAKAAAAARAQDMRARLATGAGTAAAFGSEYAGNLRRAITAPARAYVGVNAKGGRRRPGPGAKPRAEELAGGRRR